MKICIVAEGCYPYVVGGVSSWIHSLINSFPNHEFIVLAIVADRSYRGKFKYELPENVSQVYEVYLNDVEWTYKDVNSKAKFKMKRAEVDALRSLVLNEDVDWSSVFQLFARKDMSLNDLLMGKAFMDIVKECYKKYYSDAVFADFLWTMRSLYLPLFRILIYDVPEAEMYHCVATGYAGVLGVMAKKKYDCGLLISEHGIYTREREEELIKAKWVRGIYKNIWIEQFKKMSVVAYDRADLVTSLYEHARELQIELGAPPYKLQVTPNGINVDQFVGIPGKLPEDEGFVNIGAVLRMAPIKDVKTLIRSFFYAKKREKSLKLWIMGPWEEEPEYSQECFDMVENMGIEDVVFTGRINVREYLGRMDCTILTSISEGQPLTILEGYAAHLPVIATDVGNCRGLIYGEDDDFGEAGILVHIMNVEEIANAMIRMAREPEARRLMGESGYKRLMRKYKLSDMKETYSKIYQDFDGEYCLETRKREMERWLESEFD